MLAIAGISETLEKVSVSTILDQSRLVSVSTTTNFHCLKKSRSRQFWNLKSRTNFPGIVLYSLDNFHLGLGLSLKIYSLSLGLDIETGIEKVSVSVSTLRPWFPKSQSRSRDSNLSIANPCTILPHLSKYANNWTPAALIQHVNTSWIQDLYPASKFTSFLQSFRWAPPLCVLMCVCLSVHPSICVSD